MTLRKKEADWQLEQIQIILMFFTDYLFSFANKFGVFNMHSFWLVQNSLNQSKMIKNF